MGQGLTDLYTSRRTHFIKCKFWNQDENENYVSKNEILYNTIPTGIFYAKEANAYSNDNNTVSGDFMFDTTTITLITQDDISKMKVNDRVLTDDNNFWIVTNVQKNPLKKQRNYMKSKYCNAEYYISLRR